MKLSVIIPVYNEELYLEKIINKVLETGFVHEVITIDDGSKDNSINILEKFQQKYPSVVKIISHPQNRGKGAAIRTGLNEVTGDLVLIQDADLEYDPESYEDLIKPFNDNAVKVVYGSRNLKKNPKSSLAFYYGGRLLSVVTNILYGSRITDESTCYKVFRTDVLKEMDLITEGFDFCPEVTSKALKKGIEIYEVPINYNPRTRMEGKKIKWYDGVIAIWTLVKYRFTKP